MAFGNLRERTVCTDELFQSACKHYSHGDQTMQVQLFSRPPQHLSHLELFVVLRYVGIPLQLAQHLLASCIRPCHSVHFAPFLHSEHFRLS